MSIMNEKLHSTKDSEQSSSLLYLNIFIPNKIIFFFHKVTYNQAYTKFVGVNS